MLVSAQQEVLWFDVSMDELPVVEVLQSGDYLAADQGHCCDVELLVHPLEKVLQRRTQHVHHHYSIEVVTPEVVQARNASLAAVTGLVQIGQQLGFILQLRML